ncbi:hypothetical protein SAMN05660653_00624 [Desulfonatronum thiosulfatophilum]|uniref:Uncharacterized protein n=1 Tax=Desulfonatronum thiosulfatophilum TaxID=617002 RepID=A0A1G6AWR0_9BACT|nr:hypothetical protein [Desulfonatronum thiosulfatophilum]SDB12798.1 hypothetical protein SAMN05660653_00624 [Desulfonatronum thiosulfatophilum]
MLQPTISAKSGAQSELSDSGSLHERLGPKLLEERDIAPSYARFAQTHGSWRNQPDLPLGDLLVALADTLGHNPWDVWLTVDGIIENADTAVDRLYGQESFY